VIAIHHETHLVPLAGGLHDAGGGRIQAVVGPGRRQARLAVRMPRVVQYLHLRSAPVDRVVARVLAGAVEDPAVAVLRDVPLERQLEVLELLLRDDVGRGLDSLQRAVHHLPPRRQRIHLPPAPPCRGLPVEQQAPARGALVRRERVERRGAAGQPACCEPAAPGAASQVPARHAPSRLIAVRWFTCSSSRQVSGGSGVNATIRPGFGEGWAAKPVPAAGIGRRVTREGPPAP